jgi:hypothetical protein
MKQTCTTNPYRTEKTGLYCSRVEQQSFVRPRVQAHIGSIAELPGARGSPWAQHDVLVKSLETVAGAAVGENSGWKIKLIIFEGGTCGSVHAQTLNNDLKELGVIESKRNTVRKGLVHELPNAQDTVLCSYFAQRSGARGEGRGRESTVGEAFPELDYF